jgi:hypothetical protein
VVRALVTNLHEELVQTTPVDTGWARTNWVPNIGSPFQGTAGTRLDAEAGRLDRSPATAGLAQMRGYDVAQGDVHVTNNVPYIESLNAGGSRQAPPAFVQGAIVRAIESVGGVRT